MTGSEPARPSAPVTPSSRCWLGALAWAPVAGTLGALRHASLVPWIVRDNAEGDEGDLPPTLADEYIDARTKRATDGHGPLFHRTFGVAVRDPDLDAAGLIDRLVTDLDRPAPFGLITFEKSRGRRGALEVGDEYVVRMPTPWDGPVRVVHRDATSFRLATLTRHLEAGQIEFRACDEPDGLRFEIEAWSVAGDLVARLLYVDLPIGREVQLALWVQYALTTIGMAGGRRDGPVRTSTRRLDRLADRALDPTRT